jgi:hypothetical protein
MPLITQAPRPTPLPWLAAALTGLPLVALGLALLIGDPRMALLLIAVSVVCTAGIGALFWLALAMVIGLAVLYGADQLARRMLGRPAGIGLFPGIDDRSGGTQPQSRQDQRQQMLQDYVQQRLARQGDSSRLRSDLEEVGWSSAQIEAAFAAIRGRP